MRQTGQPLARQRVDLLRAKRVAQRLQPRRFGAGQKAVVERLEGDARLGGLSLGPLVAVDAQLGVVGKVGRELEEERAEISVDGVDVEVVDHRRAAHQPRVAGPGNRVAAFLGAVGQGLLLRPPDKQHPLGAGEAGQVLMGDVVFALPRGKVHQRHALLLDELVDRGHKRLGDGVHQHRGDNRVAPVTLEEPDHAELVLQLGLVEVEVHPVDALDLKRHVLGEDLAGAAG